MGIPSENFHNKSRQVFDELRNSELWQVRDDVYIPTLQHAVLVMLVKNVEDIIGINLRHHYTLGFRKFFILDNNSNDTTASIIKSFKYDHKDASVFYSTDFLEGHYQQTKTEAMARFAEFYLREEGVPSWIFPIDADEFITCCTKETDQAIENFTKYLMDPHAQVFVFNWAQSALFSKERNELTTFEQTLSQTEFVVWKRMKPCVTKSAYRTGHNMSPTMGNHFVNAYQGTDEGLRSMVDIGFCMLHFPFRSLDQFRLKITDGMRALALTNYDQSIGHHWRAYFADYQEKGDSALKWYLDEHIRQCL
ncbi:glycosyltransferase family 2 protein [Commensalibacter papalotli (ex Botero et al. 2024)]|uniref:Capsular polysaccharide biosynthesis protein n=1 Tax=Commensalibacter papalotli (ex Botero et al. 2024) TaxID=2972766 RepID=A0ABM9HKK4_9PROT|nr:glycosyltransferase family 2 protein [Commensalibacter papalotli (ex Botero et al. 2024)]CAI3922872.1 Capsular polysaccharide biosynthesis protein [Commensalibacter papalotli (ex Botero et al. 2024)]CAI3929188.1 Capsular polysaccharide biosynthesis protein [Commensalibacter papalotli (ex Botero et al. 2024)]